MTTSAVSEETEEILHLLKKSLIENFIFSAIFLDYGNPTSIRKTGIFL